MNDFGARFSDRRSELYDVSRNGVPPLSYVPGADGMLVRDQRHLIAAPKKTGKSIGTLVQCVDICLAGGTVAILDCENGTNTFVARLAPILEARDLKPRAVKKLLSDQLRYYDFPRIEEGDAAHLVEELGDRDLVVFDSQRMF